MKLVPVSKKVLFDGMSAGLEVTQLWIMAATNRLAMLWQFLCSPFRKWSCTTV